MLFITLLLSSASLLTPHTFQDPDLSNRLAALAATCSSVLQNDYFLTLYHARMLLGVGSTFSL